MAGSVPALVADSSWWVLYWASALALLGLTQFLSLSDEEGFRLVRHRPRSPGGVRRRFRKNLLAVSGQVVPATMVDEVRPLVEWQLRLRVGKGRRVVRWVGLVSIIWLAGGLAAAWALRARWSAAFIMVYAVALLLVMEAFHVWQTARMRWTAEVNGWVVDCRVADAP